MYGNVEIFIFLCKINKCTRWFQLLSLWMKFLKYDHSMKAVVQDFSVVLFMLDEVEMKFFNRDR